MGYIVAANPLAQMLFSPLVGWWSNKIGNIRVPVVISLMIFGFSSAMYSSIELLSDNRKYFMLASRFLVGISSGVYKNLKIYLGVLSILYSYYYFHFFCYLIKILRFFTFSIKCIHFQRTLRYVVPILLPPRGTQKGQEQSA